MRDEPRQRDLPKRLLRLLSLLQGRREWTGGELAARLAVTERTVRRDVDRLRELDYPVASSTGRTGGYRLTSGRNLPPLLLDDEEAIAVAIGLATAGGGSVAGIEESSTRALAKLEQVLPARLRPRLTALGTATSAIPTGDGPRPDLTTLAVLASCCRDAEVLSFDYRGRDERTSARRVEPHSLVTVRGRWYLLAFDPGPADWRTFRVDRIDRPAPTRRRFTARDLPAADAAAYLTRSFATATYRYTVTMTVRLSADELRGRLFDRVRGEVIDLRPGWCEVRIRAESADLVTQYVAAVAALGAELRIDAPADITARLARLRRLLRP